MIDDIKQMAIAAGELLQARFGEATIHEKSTQNLVTEADLASERLITQMVHDRYPDHQFLGEESEFTGSLEHDHLWVVDPLDATNNYAHGIPHYCVSVAYAQRGTVQAGAIFDPCRNELFWAERGKGAFLNGAPIQVSVPTGITRSVIATGFYYDRGMTMERTLQAIGDLFRANMRGLRRMGAAALDLAWVACGRYQGFFEYQLSPWDYAAGALIVEEAGGVVRDRTGGPLRLESQSMIASCEVIADEFTRLVAWPEKDDQV